MSLLIKNWSIADWKELLQLARIGANNAMMGEFTEVEEVPPHGRLGDLDAAVELAIQYCPDDDGSCSKADSDLRELLDEIESLPTIIPAEEGET